MGGRRAQDVRTLALRLGVVSEVGGGCAARTSRVFIPFAFIVGCEASGGAVWCCVWFV